MLSVFYLKPTTIKALGVALVTHCLINSFLTRSRRQEAVSKNLLRTMTVCSGYSEVRVAASQKLDGWIQNAKVSMFKIFRKLG